MTPEDAVLAIDLGTSGMKVALTDARGRVLDWESEPLSVSYLPGGGAEQSPTACPPLCEAAPCALWRYALAPVS